MIMDYENKQKKPDISSDGCFFMHIPLKPLLSWVASASIIFATAFEGLSFPAAPGFEEGLATSSTNDDTRSLFKLPSESSASAT